MTFRRGLAAIALGGLALRLVYAYAIVKSRPLLGDALEFQQQANLLASGHGLIEPQVWFAQHIARPSADKPPVYPLLEAVVSLVGGRTWAWHDIVDLVAGTSTIWVTGLLGRQVGGGGVRGARLGLIAAGIAAVYPLLIAADGSLRSESVFALFVTLSLLCALRLREDPSVRRAVALGFVIALAALTRSEGLLLVVLLPFGLAGRRRGLTSVVACVVVLSPWLVHCWATFGQPVLISTNVGGLLAGANCPPTYHGPLLGQWDLACLRVGGTESTNEAVGSDHLRDVGLRYARDHAGRLPVVIAARIGRSFELFLPSQQWAMEAFFEGRNETVEEAGVLVYYVVALLAIAGTVLLWRRRGPWRILLSPLVLVVFVSVTGYGFTRFRVGAEPALIVLAAVALDASLSDGRWRRQNVPMLPRIALAGLAAVVAAWFAVLLVDAHRVNQAAATHGTIAAVGAALTGPQAQFNRRIADLRAARFLNPDTSISLDIAGAYQVRGGAANLRHALVTVNAVLRSEPDNLDAWAALYRIQRTRGDAAGQHVALAHAQRLDPLDFRSR